MDIIENFLRELRTSPATRWIANEIDETISQGVSMNVRDATADSGFFELLPSHDLPVQERSKRQKYETTRAFSEEEKVEIILKALEVMYLDLPAIKKSAIKNINEFDKNISAIFFSNAEEDIHENKYSHSIKLSEVESESNEYKGCHSKFIEELS